jgi:hypothetical protein
MRWWEQNRLAPNMDFNTASERAERARARATEAVARSGELAEEHARRAEAQGDDDRAQLEWARAARAREIVARAQRRASDF